MCINHDEFYPQSLLFASCVLLAIAISLVIYLLHSESANLRIIQSQILDLMRNTPQEIFDNIVNESEDQ